jgi:hypothetical protein
MELTVLGWSQPQIAADLGMSQAAVCKLLKRVETRLLRELAETVQRQRARQALRLDWTTSSPKLLRGEMSPNSRVLTKARRIRARVSPDV